MYGPSRIPNLEEPHCRGYTVGAYRKAVETIAGVEAWLSVEQHLPADARAAVTQATAPDWVAVKHVIAVCHSIWEVTAERDRSRYFAIVQKQVELGFGRVRRLILSACSPRELVLRAPALWEQQHTHGALEAEVDLAPPSSARLAKASAVASLRLRAHPYTESPQARATVAEVFRHIVSLSRASSVAELHAREGDSCVIRLSWQ